MYQELIEKNKQRVEQYQNYYKRRQAIVEQGIMSPPDILRMGSAGRIMSNLHFRKNERQGIHLNTPLDIEETIAGVVSIYQGEYVGATFLDSLAYSQTVKSNITGAAKEFMNLSQQVPTKTMTESKLESLKQDAHYEMVNTLVKNKHGFFFNVVGENNKPARLGSDKG